MLWKITFWKWSSTLHFQNVFLTKKTWLENGLSNSLCPDKKLCIKIKKKTKCIFIKYVWQPVSGSLVSLSDFFFSPLERVRCSTQLFYQFSEGKYIKYLFLLIWGRWHDGWWRIGLQSLAKGPIKVVGWTIK